MNATRIGLFLAVSINAGACGPKVDDVGYAVLSCAWLLLLLSWAWLGALDRRPTDPRVAAGLVAVHLLVSGAAVAVEAPGSAGSSVALDELPLLLLMVGSTHVTVALLAWRLGELPRPASVAVASVVTLLPALMLLSDDPGTLVVVLAWFLGGLGVVPVVLSLVWGRRRPPPEP